jgi:nicotinamide mononucleotide transporter
MSVLEIIAVSFSLLCVWLSVKRNVLNWPMGIIAVSAYMIFFYQVKLFADMVLQAFFIIQGFYGWYTWTASKREEKAIVVTSFNTIQRALTCACILAVTAVWGFLLSKYTEASAPYVDAFASTASFTANWLMARRKIENWLLWITADIVYVGLFWYKGLYLSSGIYLVFLGLAVAGLLEWIKSTNTSTASH